MELKTTPLIDEHKCLGAKLAPFGGWLMPIQYAGIIAEHAWTRTNVSLFDICHMGEFIFSGDAHKSGFDRITTLDPAAIPVGSCHYGFLLTDTGGVADDLIIYRLGESEWMVVVNAATTESDEERFRSLLLPGASFKNVSSSTAKLDLQGPRSLEVLKNIIGQDVAELGYYKFGRFDILGEKMIVSRTGYTGELGYELYIASGKVVELWRLLLSNGLVKPAGLGARDVLRLEMCYPLYGQDLSIDHTPIEAGLERFVDTKRKFIGQDWLVDSGRPYKSMIYFKAESRRSPRHNYKIRRGGEEIGVVTSGTFSPSLSCGIGMGYVNRPCPVGTRITVSENDVNIEAVVTEKPFYKNGSLKKSEGIHANS